MSYILDALRKSDQQRQRGAAPTLHAGQTTAAAPKQPAFLVYGLLAVVLVGAGMAIGWLRPWQQAAPGRAELVAAKPLESTPRQPPPAPTEMAPQPKPEPQLRNAAPPAQTAPAPALAPAKPRRPARAKPEPRSTRPEADTASPARTAAPAPAVGTAADAARVQTVISMAELPLALQQELPPMTISVHAYSGNPGARLVGIDNRILREGDYVIPGLELEEITPDGMIFGYKGYRFRRGLK
jgi:general secretion pathway protein B